jgi:hypothetical protein
VAIRSIEVPFRDDYNVGVGADLASGSPMGLRGRRHRRRCAISWRCNRKFSRYGGFILPKNYTGRSESMPKLASAPDCSEHGVVSRLAFPSRKIAQSRPARYFLLLNCRVGLEHLSIKAPRLTSECRPAHRQAQIFAERFGNMFVRGLVRGGLFVGVFRLDVHSERDQQDISADLEGSLRALQRQRGDEIQRGS